MNWVLQNPWMLLWGLAALVPLILYLLRRRTTYRVEWAAMQFLHAANKGPVSRKRYRRWLLLATRMLIPILVALVATTPGCPNPPDKTNDTRLMDTHWVLLFDVSASMGPRADQSSALNVAVEKAIMVLDEADEGDVFTLLTSGIDAAKKIVVSSADRDRVRSEVLSLESTAGRFHTAASISLANQIASSGNGQSHFYNRLVLFSDFATSEDHSDRSPFARLTEFHDVRLVSCRSDDLANIAITNLTANPGSTTIGQSFDCLVELTPFEIDTKNTVTVELFVDGERQDRQRVVIPSGNSGRVQFSVRSRRIGDLEVEARITSNGLLIDDRRFLVVPSRSRINVLCVEGQPGAADSFIAATSGTTGSGFPEVSTVAIDASQLSDVAMRSFDLVTVFSVDEFSDEQRTSLMRFVRRGGRLTLSPGLGLQAPSWQALLNEIAPPSAFVLSGEIASGDFRFHPLDYAHPILDGFRDHPQAGILDAPIQRYYKLLTDPDSVSRVLDFDSGEPALVSWSFERGKVLLATTPLTSISDGSAEPWNHLAAWWSYVPLINESVFWLFGSSSPQPFVRVGETIRVDTRQFDFAGELKVRQPDGELTTCEVITGEAAADSNMLLPTRTPGFMRVYSPLGGDIDTVNEMRRSFAINPDTEECDSPQMDLVNMRHQISTIGTPPPLQPTDKSQRSRFVYLTILILIAVALLLESVLANSPSPVVTGARS